MRRYTWLGRVRILTSPQRQLLQHHHPRRWHLPAHPSRHEEVFGLLPRFPKHTHLQHGERHPNYHDPSYASHSTAQVLSNSRAWRPPFKPQLQTQATLPSPTRVALPKEPAQPRSNTLQEPLLQCSRSVATGHHAEQEQHLQILHLPRSIFNNDPWPTILSHRIASRQSWQR